MPIKERPDATARADEIALAGLTFLAGDGERIAGFLEATGMDPSGLRDAVKRKDFGAGVLAYILSDEPLLLVFCAHANLDPQQVARAHDLLSPPADPDAVVRRH
ncbi:hypothetical protein AZC_1853 [Azorhizobium caulinodans ORS 571]|uniref:DUF3572 family protein n=1 Tax=Azorhizobium caulinodans (strain ATCC 43989 / DSM 5975 / JCM 20966 / LMG 6465 / NBRC 14845 / NCIMB 13405 / ORS 571) TaxID=438753 RepID=A8I2C9_AZOC5|nr:DUF3572 domain-containing protein [Azorhizobium caulinodans]BAF87851.1 hypothetical protein AZC_1853 [Azorhizobium caulinodans ORS 571]